MSKKWMVPIAVFLVLAGARAALWGVIHDEGGTYDIVLFHLDLAERVPPGGVPRRLVDELESSAPRGFGEFFTGLTSSRNMHPPGYYVLLYGWTRLFGSSALALRIPGIAVGAFAVFAMFCLARLLTRSDASAMWASLLLAVSPAHIGFAVYLRPYGLEIAIAISSCLALLRWHERMHERGQWWWFGSFALLSALGLYVLYHYVFVLLFQFGFLLVAAGVAPRLSFRADLGKVILAGVCVALLYAPWVPYLVATLGRLEGGHYFDGFTPIGEWPGDLFGLAVRLTLGETATWRQAAFVALLAGGLVLAVMIRRQKPSSRGSGTESEWGASGLLRTHRIFWSCFLVYPVTMIAADALRDTHTFLVWKTSIILLPLAILSVVMMLQKLGRPRMQSAALGLCAATLFSATATNIVAATFDDRHGQDVLARHIRENDRQDHVVVLNTDVRGHALTSLVYWKNLGVRDVRIAFGPRDRLDTVMASLAADPELTQITLVNLRVGYRKAAIWSKEEAERALATAQAGGKESRLFHRQRILYTKGVGQ